jgi:hypothetical protein
LHERGNFLVAAPSDTPAVELGEKEQERPHDFRRSFSTKSRRHREAVMAESRLTD